MVETLPDTKVLQDRLSAVEHLAGTDMLAGLHLLHCHMGSQVFDIRAIKTMASEMAHLYVALRRSGAPIEVLDLGGGLGVDYDGTQTASSSSVNYTVEQYAADIVHRVGTICDEATRPASVWERGRVLRSG